jgi:hypothetical protein
MWTLKYVNFIVIVILFCFAFRVYKEIKQRLIFLEKISNTVIHIVSVLVSYVYCMMISWFFSVYFNWEETIVFW